MTREQAIEIIKNLPIYRAEMEYDKHSELMQALEMAIESLEKDCSECNRRKFYQQGYQDGLNADKWISCKKELPKTTGVYQVKRVVYEGYFRNYIVTCAYFDGQDTWHNDNRVNHGRPYLTDIIAWKPLDEAYKGE